MENQTPNNNSTKDLEKGLKKREMKKVTPRIVFQSPFAWAFFGAFISHFSGNGIGWNILHFILGKYYVAYKLAELLFTGGAQ